MSGFYHKHFLKLLDFTPAELNSLLQLAAKLKADGNTAYRINFFDAVYVISPENDTQQIIGIRQINVYRISFHTEVTTIQVNVIAYIKTVHQTT